MNQEQLIAPCGMNCALCQAYQGKGLACYGCGQGGERKSCRNCSIRKCEHKKAFCFECAEYPCKRLKALDKRYRAKYRMSMLENLAFVQKKRGGGVCAAAKRAIPVQQVRKAADRAPGCLPLLRRRHGGAFGTASNRFGGVFQAPGLVMLRPIFRAGDTP